MQRIEVFENGICGLFNGQEVKIGSRAFLAEELEASGDLPSPPSKQKHSQVFMSIAGRICAVFVFGDQTKPTSSRAVQSLRSAGYHLALVSGDENLTTKTIAEELGVEQAQGGKLPKEKATLIAELQEQGHRVAMVGDGINDAPALIQADLAIAVHSGSQLGKEAADLTLMRGDPLQLIDFLELAKKVRSKVYQNLGCSFVYNAVSIPVAMSGLLTPLVAVSAMLLSSLTVIGNTLLLMKRA
jgi:P-type E1-E2 ATPase